MDINEITKEYGKTVDILDLEILIAFSLSKTREFVLTHSEYEIPAAQLKDLKSKISRRMAGEPIAYLTGHKEFHGLDFEVNKHTLIPRPETEMMVEEVLDLLRSELRSISVVDIGTGSGCIITSIAKATENLEFKIPNLEFIGADISKDALKIAKGNATAHGLGKKIKFLHGNLLTPFIKETETLKNDKLIITANLPYLSEEIYESAPIDVKEYEPKSALYSAEEGLKHYRILLEQLKEAVVSDQRSSVTVFLEISPEQKQPIEKLIKSIFPKAKIRFKKDLAGKWRMVTLEIQ